LLSPAPWLERKKDLVAAEKKEGGAEGIWARVCQGPAFYILCKFGPNTEEWAPKLWAPEFRNLGANILLAAYYSLYLLYMLI
jgi:hypothetical protein